MLEKLEELDQQLFLFLNSLHSEWLDVLMYWITYKYTWYPVYVLLIILVVSRYRWKGALIMLSVVISVGLADQLTSGFMKPYFGRLRPCHDPDIGHLINVVAGCGGRFGFASSHASTTFALATSLWLLLKDWSSWFAWGFLWAAIVAYSRIHVGVHYPSDILVGALGGIVVGWITVQLHLWLTTRIYGEPISSKSLQRYKQISENSAGK
ncbi:phosphatase PAP2 family protein [Catalinimonas niigatensis]|uniref:phosphatase PAP2 family protein n=1 Tax=Catalinimonas niigatensis TaxID=1397264 RepID=UPI00266657FD|nr:phosphatase PAP2 family protein [Catalinimonas niigatensis]WPP52602.1 phosphatase PAP2 family protein [Catalinimonas niigatensis]